MERQGVALLRGGRRRRAHPMIEMTAPRKGRSAAPRLVVLLPYLWLVAFLLLMLIILPFFTSFLIRVYAWINILQHDGALNQLLLTLGAIREPLVWLASDTAVYIGIVYSYFPFMVLPLFATLEKFDPTLEEAAADL